MRLLPAIAAVVAAIIAVASLVRGDWGVLIVSGLLCAVAVSAAVTSRRRGPPPSRPDDDL